MKHTKLYNITKAETIATDIEIAESFLSKAFGLMFRKPKPILFIFENEQQVNLHTWFVKSNVNILFINQSQILTKLATNVPQWTNKVSGIAKYVIELPICSTTTSPNHSLPNLEVGDQLDLNITNKEKINETSPLQTIHSNDETFK